VNYSRLQNLINKIIECFLVGANICRFIGWCPKFVLGNYVANVGGGCGGAVSSHLQLLPTLLSQDVYIFTTR
jgi:hypothetical protein